jgi:hypothetical protein
MSERGSKLPDSVNPARLASAALLTGLAAGALLGAADVLSPSETPSIHQQFQAAFSPGVLSSNPVAPIVVHLA